MRNPRLRYFAMAALIFVAGVLSRIMPFQSPLVSKYLGDALYAAIFYALLGLISPSGTISFRTIATSVFVVAVECFQLTGIPLQMRQGNDLQKLVSILLGTRFSWADMAAYSIGLGTVMLVDRNCIVGRKMRV